MLARVESALVPVVMNGDRSERVWLYICNWVALAELAASVVALAALLDAFEPMTGAADRRGCADQP